jgi:L-alanine-DL-glutamate epimerase-like enolase superfamily enzyme
LKIDAISTRWLRVPLEPPIADSTHVLRYIDWIVVEVRAGDHTGLCAMLSFDYAPALLRGIVDSELRRHLLGRDADDIRAIHQLNLRETEYVGRPGLAMWGTSAIDTALWDLLARRLGVPVSLLFGRADSSVPVYGSGGWISWTDEELADSIAGYLRRGFRAVKVKIGGPSEDWDVARVSGVRQMIGPAVELAVDCNQGLTLERALRTARRLENCRLLWIEEPFPRDDVESYCRLAAATETPLAAGEREFGLEGFRRLVAARAIAIVQPDLLRVGGVTGWRLAAGLAEANLLRVAPHFYKEWDVHLASSLPNLVAIECFDWLDPLLVDPLEVESGRAIVPTRPGFGVAFREDAIREYAVRAKTEA